MQNMLTFLLRTRIVFLIETFFRDCAGFSCTCMYARRECVQKSYNLMYYIHVHVMYS